MTVWICRTLALAIVVGALVQLESYCLFGQTTSLDGKWVGMLETAGGPLTFGLELIADGDEFSAFVTNGVERIKVPRTEYSDGLVELHFDYYKSSISARLVEGQAELRGQWTKRKSAREFSQMAFRAIRANSELPEVPPADRFLGKWAVRFSSDPDPSVGIFQPAADGRVQGTFLTTTGDYRYLFGWVDSSGALTLSCFDGSHAFLFRATIDSPGKIKGDFWSGTKSHETWTAARNEQAQLPDGFAQAPAKSVVDWGAIQFPDLEGRPRRLDDPEFLAKVRIVYLFGSWCPNCHDAGEFFSKLHGEFRDNELKILGLAFESTGDFSEDATQVKLYRDRHNIQYPLLVAGIADKEQAALAIPFLDRVKAFPTIAILDRTGAVRAIYSGFNGPATGEAYEKMNRDFRARIKVILAE